MLLPATSTTDSRPYSSYVVAQNFVFISGCIATDHTGKITAEGFEEQALQALQNFKSAVEASGSSIDKIVKTTVFLKDLNDYGKMNAMYTEFFQGHKPARSCIEVARLPLDALFEIEGIALA